MKIKKTLIALVMSLAIAPCLAQDVKELSAKMDSLQAKVASLEGRYLVLDFSTKCQIMILETGYLSQNVLHYIDALEQDIHRNNYDQNRYYTELNKYSDGVAAWEDKKNLINRLDSVISHCSEQATKEGVDFLKSAAVSLRNSIELYDSCLVQYLKTIELYNGLKGGGIDEDEDSQFKYLKTPVKYEDKSVACFKIFQVLEGHALAHEESRGFGREKVYYGNVVLLLGEGFYCDQVVKVKNPQRTGTYSYTTKGGSDKVVPVITGELE